MMRSKRRAMDAGAIPEDARRKTAMTLRSGRGVVRVHGFEVALCPE